MMIHLWDITGRWWGVFQDEMVLVKDFNLICNNLEFLQQIYIYMLLGYLKFNVK